MSSNDKNIRASFRNLDAPAAIDPAFANQVHAAIADAQPEPDDLVPTPPNTQHPIPNTEPRFRWQDLAAAAVLILALAGLLTGTIRLLREDEPSPVISVDAPQTPAESAYIASSPATTTSPAAKAEGCFHPDAVVWTNEEAGVRFRETPSLDGAVLQELAIGTELVIIGENAEVDADGYIWCLVRNPEAGQTGYVMEQFLDSQPPAGTAPELAGVPVINVSGSAANDGNLPGVMPHLGTTYDLLWEGDAPGDETPSRMYAIDAWLVQWLGAVSDQNGTVRVFDLTSGTERWSTEIATGYPVVVSPAGILVGQTFEGEEAARFTLQLHDLATGAQIWEAGPFDLNQLGMDSVFVTDTGAYVLDGETNLVALDLTTGNVQWEFDARQGRSNEEMLGPDCANASPTCERTGLPHALAIFGDVAYRYVPLSGELMAINLADGSLRWSNSLTNVTGITAPVVRLIATDLGVIPVVAGPDAEDGHYVGMWISADGTEKWTKSIEITSAFVFQGALLVVTWTNPDSPDDCCPITAIRLSTGTTTWGEPSLPDLYFVGTYSGSAFQMTDTAPVLTDRAPVPGEIFSYAPAGRFSELVTADEIVPGCTAIIPTATSRHVVCIREVGQFAVYQSGPLIGTADSTVAPGAQTEGCFEPEDNVTINQDSVNLRQAPGVEGEIVLQLKDGAGLMVIGPGAEMDADGNTWCQVRDDETALVGYVAEEFLTPAEP